VSAPAVPAPIAAPSMTGVLELLDDLGGLAGAADGPRRRVEELTGLRGGELQTLLAVASGVDRTADVAERTGQVDDAATATLRALRGRGLVSRTHGESWRLTESGRVVQQQAEGLRIRVLHGILGALGEDAADGFRTTVQALATVLSAEGASSAAALRGP
jgi:DNA-binding MarR family transcriptional regulator